MSLDNIGIDEQWVKEIAEFPLVEALASIRRKSFLRTIRERIFSRRETPSRKRS